jgi:hypothetical protein
MAKKHLIECDWCGNKKDVSRATLWISLSLPKKENKNMAKTYDFCKIKCLYEFVRDIAG